MTKRDLQQALRAVEPAAVFVTPRVLENIIRQTHNVSGLLWRVPHGQSAIVDRQTLFLHVEQDELALGADQLLPARVILLVWPDDSELEAADGGPVLLECWRRLFHASVHLALENRFADGSLTVAVVRQRLKQIGPAQVQEIRTVLTQERYLTRNADECSLFSEFAAVLLELHFFAADLLPVYFPAIGNLEAIEELLSQAVDAEALYQRTRLAGAPEPVLQRASDSQEAHEYYWKLVHSSKRAAARGNTVRAAIQLRRAARVAPAALAYDTREQSVAEIWGLLDRLQEALALSPATAEEWRRHLPTLLDKADQGGRPVEAALLYDLQKVCLDHEREIYTLDLVEWLLSAGRRPFKRPLPSQRLVRLTRTLRGASQRLTMARLSEHDRSHLAALLQDAVQNSEKHVRERFRPLLTIALQDVGLEPHNALEATAFAKLVEELLDRIVASGFITFSELRDALSRNQLKLPDLSDPQDFMRGDPLLRLDRRLATLLDGVYRRSEFYLRWLERGTALNFGTPAGRMLTLFVTLPFLGAFLLLQAVSIVLHEFGVPSVPGPAWYPLWLVSGFIIMGLLHSAHLRQATTQAALALARPLYATFVAGPLWLLRNTPLTRVTDTWTFQLFYCYGLKPVLLAGFLWLVLPFDFQTLASAGVLFLLANVLMNSRPGQVVGEAMARALLHVLDLIRAGLIPGLIRLIARVFKEVLHLGEAVLFTVDEWLRFRGGDSHAAMVARALASLFWFPVSYLLRFHMVVLIEPGINPLKLPFSSIATKLLIPLVPVLQPMFVVFFAKLAGDLAAGILAWWIIFWLPDVFGFICWEMKENWGLYRANRRRYLRPVAVGPHGESVRGLLQPGFHSGTVPKLFARLRHAQLRAHRTGHWSSVRACRLALEEIEKSVASFITREFCTLLKQTPSWQDRPLAVGRVLLATNQIHVELARGDHADQPLLLHIENWDGWFVANLESSTAWLESLAPGQHGPLCNAVAMLYKLSGIDLIPGQEPTAITAHAITPDSLVTGMRLLTNGPQPPASARELAHSMGSTIVAAPRLLDRRWLVYRNVGISWNDCVHSWQAKPAPGDSMHLLVPGFDFLEAAHRDGSNGRHGESTVPLDSSRLIRAIPEENVRPVS